jgi:hypothetical protein
MGAAPCKIMCGRLGAEAMAKATRRGVFHLVQSARARATTFSSTASISKAIWVRCAMISQKEKRLLVSSSITNQQWRTPTRKIIRYPLSSGVISIQRQMIRVSHRNKPLLRWNNLSYGAGKGLRLPIASLYPVTVGIPTQRLTDFS